MPERKMNYVYYSLCRKCGAVNTPDPPGICASWSRKEPKRPVFFVRPNSNYRTKRNSAKCGALPWVYDHRLLSGREICFLRYKNYYISIQKMSGEKFCYFIGDGENMYLRRKIPELVSARTRSIKHLARLTGNTFDELIRKIKDEEEKNKSR